MIQNRATQGIPINEASIANIMYNNSSASSFLKPEEIAQKSSTGKNYAQKRPGINYKSFGRKIEL